MGPTQSLISVAVALGCAAGAAAQVVSFTDQAIARGISYYVTQGSWGAGQYGCGVVLCDLDGDGDEDVIVCGAADDRIGVYENSGRGTFVDRTTSSGIGVRAKASGFVAGDYDGDGDLDLFLTRWLKTAILFRNDGGLHFTDTTFAAGLGGLNGAGAGCSFGDYDGDGWLDLAVTNRTGTAGSTLGNRLYRNQGDGTFEDVTQASGVQNGWAAFQSSFFDIDGDHDLDLLVANDKGVSGQVWNRFYRNLGGGLLVEQLNSGLSISIDAMGLAFGDLDGDLTAEVYVPNVPSGNVLLRSGNGGQWFEDVSALAGVQGFASSWAPIFFDADNDADLDLFVATSWPFQNLFFISNGPWPMPEVAAEAGLGSAGDSYCAATGDVDGDGDEDLLIESRFASIQLMINHADELPDRHWVRFEPHGPWPNRFAVGMRIETYAGGSNSVRDVSCGVGYKSQGSLRPHVGLGPATVVEKVSIVWPGGKPTRQLLNYPADRVWPLWPPKALGDADQDGVLSASDRAALAAAVGQPFEPPLAIFDLDGDADVDEVDAALLDHRLADFDGDGDVDGTDLAALLGQWGTAGAGDFDGDGSVGAGDLLILLSAWGGG